jgi:predicted Zn-dependent protease
LKSLVSVLKKTPGLRGWQVSRLAKRSVEVYSVLGEVETLRCNTVKDYALRVQTPVDDALMGESTTRFQGKPHSLADLVSDTARRARLVQNPAYAFSGPHQGGGATHAVFDGQIADTQIEAAVAYAESVHAYHKRHLSSFPLNSLELFFETFDYRIQNHKGLDVGSASTRVVCDYVVTSPDNRHEIMGIKKRRYLNQLQLEEQLEDDARVLSDLQTAVLPPTGDFAVVLAGDALDSLFDFFVAQLDGHALFNRYSIFQQGDAVVRDAREPLMIRSNPALVGGMRSYAFDELGFETSAVTLIENSHVQNFLIDGRYADLLKAKQTSALMNIEVAPGATPYADFLTDGVLELSKFSTFQPNTISGAFSGEIRLGYLHKNGKKIPIKGGSVSGSTQAAFARALKSCETAQRAAYFGPKGVFFERLTIAGD